MFGDRLRELRKNKNLSQEQLGSILNVSANAVYSWENNRTQPSIEAIKQIAEYFNVTTDYLLNFTQEDYDNIEKLKIALKEAGMWNYDIDDMSKEDLEKAMDIVQTLKRHKNKDN